MPPINALSQQEKWIAIFLVAIAMSPLFVHCGELIDRLPTGYTVSGLAVGLGLGAWLSSKLARRLGQRSIRAYAALAGFTIMMAAGGAYYARLAIETLAFAGARTIYVVTPARVEGKGTGRLFNQWAYIVPVSGARRLKINVTPELYARLDPYRSRGRDCLLIKVTTGRWGFRRTLLPGAFDEGLGIDRLIPCARY